jgi:hypothetical protein
MNLDREGVPPLVFAQLLESPVLEQDAVARFREIMDRERSDVESLLAINAQVPLRWIGKPCPTSTLTKQRPSVWRSPSMLI